MNNNRRLMDLKVDYAFKKILGSEQNKEYLIRFLNDLLKTNFKEIKIINSEIPPDIQEGKKALMDLHAVTEDGVKVNIEIQVNDRYDMVKRSLFYWSKAYQEQFKKGQAYTLLKKTIVINILDYNLSENEGNSEFHTTFHLYEDTKGYKLTDTIEMNFVELRKWSRKAEKNNLLDLINEDKINIWMAMFNLVRSKELNKEILKTLEEISGGDDTLENLMSDWEKISQDEKTWAEYSAREKAIFDEAALVKEQEERKQKAVDEKVKEIALGMIAKGYEDAEIIDLTKLTKEEVISLRKIKK